jgi:hypothetical protein
MSALHTIDPDARHHDSKKTDAMMLNMRTTVTLDRDVEAQLREAMRERGISFKVAINDAIRAGLGGGSAPPKRFKVISAPLGLDINIDKALQIAGEMEDEEILRKIELGK